MEIYDYLQNLLPSDKIAAQKMKNKIYPLVCIYISLTGKYLMKKTFKF